MWLRSERSQVRLLPGAFSTRPLHGNRTVEPDRRVVEVRNARAVLYTVLYTETRSILVLLTTPMRRRHVGESGGVASPALRHDPHRRRARAEPRRPRLAAERGRGASACGSLPSIVLRCDEPIGIPMQECAASFLSRFWLT